MPVVDKRLNKSSCLSNEENSVSCCCCINNICQVHLEVNGMQLCPPVSRFELDFLPFLFSTNADFPMCVG